MEGVDKSTRLEYIDLAKGVMILLVIAGHIIQCYFDKGEKEPLHAFIYGFHMPLFFLLSGYVGGVTQYKLKQKTFGKWLWHKVQALLIPYVVWRLLVYRFIDPVTVSPLNLDELRMLILNSRSGGAWFLLSLFCIQVVCYPVFRFDKIWAWVIPVSFLVIGIVLGGSWYYCNPYHYVSFLAGLLLFKYRESLLRPHLATTSLIVFILSEIIYPNPILLTLSLSIALLYICNQLQKSQAKDKHFFYRKMMMIGQNTMKIYLIHVLLVFPVVIQHIDVSCYRQIPVFLIVLFLSLIIALICVAISKIISQFPLVNYLLFGQISPNLELTQR